MRVLDSLQNSGMGCPHQIDPNMISVIVDAPRLGTAPPPTNSRIINILGLYIAPNRTPNIDCYWEGAIP